MKRILKIFTIPILMGIFFYFHSCQKETLEPTAQKKIQLETINHKQLVNDSQINYSLPVIESHFDIVTHTKDNYDKLTILTDKVIKITAGETVSYTFNLENTYHNGSDFQNLLVKKFNNQISYYIVLYKRNEENTDKPFKTKIVNIDDDILELDKLFLDDKKDLLTVAPDETTGGGNGGYSDCAVIYTEVEPCNQGGYHTVKYCCQHEGAIHGCSNIPTCSYVCSGTNIVTIIDLSGCVIETYDPKDSSSYGDIPVGSAGGSGSSGGGGGITITVDASGNYVLTSPIYADGTSASASFLINALNIQDANQINWLNDSNNSNNVDQLLLFVWQNGSSQEAIDFAKQAVISKNSTLLTEMIGWMNENENSQESIIASTLTLTAINNKILTSGYSPNVANILNQNANVDFVDPTYYTYFSIQCAIIKAQNPTWPNYKVYWEASKEMVHLALDIGGLVPVVGEVCDLVNGVIYTIEGDGVNASFSFGAAIPVAGWFSTGAKIAIKAGGLKLFVKANGLIDFGARNSKNFRKALGLVVGDGKHAHHIIPWELREVSELVQKAAKSPNAYHIDDALINGIPLKSTDHLTGHSLYNQKILDKLEQLYSSNLTPQQAYNQLINFTNQVKQIIQNNPNLNLGQIANLIP